MQTTEQEPSLWSDGAVSTKGGAEFLGMSTEKFRQLAARCEWPVRWLDGTKRYPRSALVAYLEGLPAEAPEGVAERIAALHAKAHRRGVKS